LLVAGLLTTNYQLPTINYQLTPTRIVMAQKLFLWLLGLLAGGLLVGCAGASSPAASAVCEVVEEQTAVSLTLRDANDAPLERVQVRYRLNDGPWTALPEAVNGRALIPGGGGAYQIRAEKAAYVAGETAVIVPAPLQPDCRVPTQAVTLRLAAAVCPTEPEPLVIQLLAPEEREDVRVTAVLPNRRTITLNCQPGADGCQAYQLPFTEAGQHQIVINDLPTTSSIFLKDGVLDYNWIAYEVNLTHGGQSRRLTGDRASRLTLDFAVAPDEEGCAQPDLRALSVTRSPEPDSDAPFPAITVHQLGGLTMTDLSAEACQQPPVWTTVAFEVMVPAGTPLAEVALLYGLDGRWQRGECGVENGRLLCRAQFPNPFINQPYAVKAVVAGQERIATQLPFSNLCILFR
jgi:hypothetical protein